MSSFDRGAISPTFKYALNAKTIIVLIINPLYADTILTKVALDSFCNITGVMGSRMSDDNAVFRAPVLEIANALVGSYKPFALWKYEMADIIDVMHVEA